MKVRHVFYGYVTGALRFRISINCCPCVLGFYMYHFLNLIALSFFSCFLSSSFRLRLRYNTYCLLSSLLTFPSLSIFQFFLHLHSSFTFSSHLSLYFRWSEERSCLRVPPKLGLGKGYCFCRYLSIVMKLTGTGYLLLNKVI